jgi:hypothetical protein
MTASLHSSGTATSWRVNLSPPLTTDRTVVW